MNTSGHLQLIDHAIMALCKVIVNQSVMGICITDTCMEGIESLIELLTEFAARSGFAQGLVSAYVKVP
jgi:hypothetical protein